MNFDKNYWLIIGGILLIIIEVILGAATGFDLLLIGVIFIVSGLLGMIIKSFTFSLISIIVLSFFYLIFGRRFVHKKLSIETKSTNVDGLMGKKGLVLKEIGFHKAGQVKVDGEIWRAESDQDIKINTEIIIKGVSGVTLKVTKSGSIIN